jgi:hypothetical protein
MEILMLPPMQGFMGSTKRQANNHLDAWSPRLRETPLAKRIRGHNWGALCHQLDFRSRPMRAAFLAARQTGAKD